MIQCVRFAENFPLKANLSQNLKRKITGFVVSNEKGSVNNHSVIVENEKMTGAGRSVVIKITSKVCCRKLIRKRRWIKTRSLLET